MDGLLEVAQECQSNKLKAQMRDSLALIMETLWGASLIN